MAVGYLSDDGVNRDLKPPWIRSPKVYVDLPPAHLCQVAAGQHSLPMNPAPSGRTKNTRRHPIRVTAARVERHLSSPESPHWMGASDCSG